MLAHSTHVLYEEPLLATRDFTTYRLLWLPRDDRHLFFAIRAKGFHPRLAMLLLHKIVFTDQPNVITC
jgi:hypothetical protein